VVSRDALQRFDVATPILGGSVPDFTAAAEAGSRAFARAFRTQGIQCGMCAASAPTFRTDVDVHLVASETLHRSDVAAQFSTEPCPEFTLAPQLGQEEVRACMAVHSDLEGGDARSVSAAALLGSRTRSRSSGR
jgi:hypothetical protein